MGTLDILRVFTIILKGPSMSLVCRANVKRPVPIMLEGSGILVKVVGFQGAFQKQEVGLRTKTISMAAGKPHFGRIGRKMVYCPKKQRAEDGEENYFLLTLKRRKTSRRFLPFVDKLF